MTCVKGLKVMQLGFKELGFSKHEIIELRVIASKLESLGKNGLKLGNLDYQRVESMDSSR